ncbi:MAG: GAF domain-containing protein [Deltaproteobacteria bacterium]|nr:GAF domain-containing protein [Deltaproteobacteria bacterium]
MLAYLAGDHMGSKVERQLEIVQQITHLGSWEWDVATGIVTWSDELYRIYGLAPKSREISFELHMSMVHADDRQRVADEIRGALQRGGRFAHRERIVRPDGSVRELDTVGEVTYAADGTTPTGLIGTSRDITDQLRRDERLRLFSDIVDHMQIGLSIWKLDPASALLRLVASNVANEKMTGIAITTSIGQTLQQAFPAVAGTELPALMLGVDEAHPRKDLPACRLHKLPGAPTFAVKAFALPNRTIGLALEDVTLKMRAQRLHFAERRALEMLAAGASLEDILSAIVAVIEELVPDTLASILTLDEGRHLRHAASASLPLAYMQSIDGVEIGPAVGSCGTAAYRRDAVYVVDIETDPLWEGFRELARPFGLRACWSIPILANDGHVLGTFAMYYKTPRRPEGSAIELISRAAHVAGIAIERRQLDSQMSALSARVEAAREDERTGIAREIHDALGQALTALKLDIAWVARHKTDEDGIATKLSEMSQTADELIQAVQRISSELRPGILDDVSLQAAIEWQAEELAQRAGFEVEVQGTLGDVQLERGFATAVFRIFQEAMTNVVRHASAKHVIVELGLERGRLRLSISDDGVGVPEPSPRTGSLGLLGMRERAKRLGGECIVQRREVGGTVVSLLVPLRFPADPLPRAESTEDGDVDRVRGRVE